MIKKIKTFLGIASFLGLWALLLFQLSITWETNEQYAHGFLVPFLCLFLLLKATPSEITKENFFTKRKVTICFIVGLPLLFTLFPLWLARGANSDWRLLNLALFFVVFGLSILHLSFHQNRSFSVKNFLFPLLFFLVAIPWPLATDLKVTQWLQQKISNVIVDTLLILEHEAKLEGTVIDVGVFGKVGVDQACSGINGLQASLVVSLFLGAYFSFPLVHRMLLIAGGMFVALFFNLSRAFSLSFITVKGKGHYIEKPLFSLGDFSLPTLHDLVGFIEMGFIFIFILLLARLSKRGLFLKTLGTAHSNWKNLAVSPPIGFSIFSIIIILTSVLGAEFHFWKREKNMLPLPSLNLDLNDSGLIIVENEISRQISAQLHFEEAKSLQWQDQLRSKWNRFGHFEINPNMEYWQLFEARWDSGGACTSVLSTHSPESCLPLTGLVQIAPPRGKDPIMIPIEIGGREILFEAYEFKRNSRKLFVFRCFWPNKMAEGQKNLFPRGGYSLEGRIKATLEGRRNVGGTMLALALANVDSFETALAKLNFLADRRLSLSE